MQDAVHAAFGSLGPSAKTIRDLLHGTWLHEPLHAVITDIPIGSWTAAVIFDVLGVLGAGRSLDTAANACVMVGLGGAVAAAITGLNDWSELESAPRRIGLVHGLLNVGGLALFATSLVARRRGSRSSGRAYAALGYLMNSVAAHLGGNLVYEHGVSVAGKHTPRVDTETAAEFVGEDHGIGS